MTEAKNIVLITIDALRADRVGCYGYHKNTTPNIDQLAKNGIIFSKAMSNGPGTPSSFCSLFSSAPPLMHDGYEKLGNKREVLAEILNQNGFLTAGFHSNAYLSRYFGYQRGFDYFFDSIFEDSANHAQNQIKKYLDKSKKMLRRSNTVVKLYQLLKDVNVPYVKAEVLNKLIFPWLEKNKGQKCFLWTHYLDVHIPYNSYGKYFRRLNSYKVSNNKVHQIASKTENPQSLSASEIKILNDLYDTGISYADEHLGNLVKIIKSVNKDAMIIITADHGDEFLEHGQLSHHPKLYNELLHVPLIIHDPQTFKSPQQTDQLVQLMDIAPTILAGLGIDRPKQFCGQDILNQPISKDRFVISEISNEHNKNEINLAKRQLAVQNSQWKFIVNRGTSQEELYNLIDDPTEQKNLINQNKNQARYFREIISDHEQNILKFSKLKEETKRLLSDIKI